MIATQKYIEQKKKRLEAYRDIEEERKTILLLLIKACERGLITCGNHHSRRRQHRVLYFKCGKSLTKLYQELEKKGKEDVSPRI